VVEGLKKKMVGEVMYLRERGGSRYVFCGVEGMGILFVRLERDAGSRDKIYSYIYKMCYVDRGCS
jgi:hypothetical protein